MIKFHKKIVVVFFILLLVITGSFSYFILSSPVQPSYEDIKDVLHVLIQLDGILLGFMGLIIASYFSSTAEFLNQLRAHLIEIKRIKEAGRINIENLKKVDINIEDLKKVSREKFYENAIKKTKRTKFVFGVSFMVSVGVLLVSIIWALWRLIDFKFLNLWERSLSYVLGPPVFSMIISVMLFLFSLIFLSIEPLEEFEEE